LKDFRPQASWITHKTRSATSSESRAHVSAEKNRS